MPHGHRRAASVKNLTFQAARALVVFAVLAVPARLRAQAQQPMSIAALDSLVERARQEWDIPGMAVAIVRNDSVLLAKGYGVRELGKPGRVDENTLFDAASLTKSFTAAAVGVLVDEGKLRWDDPVRRWLPGFELATPYLTSEVTMRDLLSHRAGLEAANGFWSFNQLPRDEIIRRMRFLRQSAPFRTTLVYSNVGYTAAGEAAARAAGVPWEELIRTRLLVPAGMAHSTASFAAAGRTENVASPHAMIDGAQRAIPREGPARDHTAPAGAVQSSAADIARWLRLQLAGGTIDGRRVVSEASLRQTQASQVVIPTTPAFRRARNLRGTSVGYGMGWQVWDYRGRPLLWHSGSGDGQFAWMALYPDDALGVAVLVNSWLLTTTPRAQAIIAGCIADALLAIAPPDCASSARALRASDPERSREARRTLEAGRIAGTKPSRPLAAYAGTYVDSLYGTVEVRLENGSLVLQVLPAGETADLSHWHLDTFLARWRRPLYREYFTARAAFHLDADGNPSAVRLRIRNDDVTLSRAPSQAP
jgi:CubicO group peptidase (beta-lactamase class C family)